MSEPSLRRHCASRPVTNAPLRIWAATRSSRSAVSRAVNSSAVCPTASAELQPNILAAPAFQLVILPSMSAPMIASPEDSTIAESRRRTASVCFRSVMSFEMATMSTGTVCLPLIGLIVLWTGNCLPERWRTHSSPAQSLPLLTLSAISSPVGPGPVASEGLSMIPRSRGLDPSASAAGYPYKRSEARFQYVIRQRLSIPITDWPISSSSSA